MGMLRWGVDSLQNPDELIPVLRMIDADKFGKIKPKDEDRGFCYEILNLVSRSFAIVIQQLPAQLRDPVCIFYLVLRALDTVEDDMKIAATTKIPLLRDFYEKISDRSFRMTAGDQKDYIRLLDQYPKVTSVFLKLTPREQERIADITMRMGNGMADFVHKGVPDTVGDYDLYCHYVAGVVGLGLSQLFVASGLQSPSLTRSEDLSNHMGLFLQKTNIIRDYFEDINELPAPRMFWPRENWGKYANNLAEFKDPANKAAAMCCLNEMVTDALRHAVYCLQYMSMIEDPQIFNCCAIPQTMAFGTLSLCYNNYTIFTGPKAAVKLRRGTTAKLMYTSNNMFAMYRHFLNFAEKLEVRCNTETSEDPSVTTTLEHLHKIKAACKAGLARTKDDTFDELRSRLLALTGGSFYVAWTYNFLDLRGPGDLPTFLSVTQHWWSILIFLISIAVFFIPSRPSPRPTLSA
uniref:Squalene synthase n=1 Tax=Botryococcus braunii TaxID=38881 RepID=A0A0P0EM74_BOTBR|nr:squalene synthase [Botryococcus braunii]